MKKIMFVLVGMLILVAGTAIASTVEEREWERMYGTPTLSSSLPDSGTYSAFTSNCSVAGFTDTSPVVGFISGGSNPYIVTVRNDFLNVYDTNCTIKATLMNSTWDNRQPSIFDSDNCASGKAIYLAGSGTINEICFNGTSLAVENSYALPSGNIEDYKGIAMADVSGTIKGALLVDDSGNLSLALCTFAGSISCSIDSRVGLQWSGRDILPIGYIDANSIPDVPVYQSGGLVWLFAMDGTEYNISIGSPYSVTDLMVFDRATTDYVVISTTTDSGWSHHLNFWDYTGTSVSSKNFQYSVGYYKEIILPESLMQNLEGEICYSYNYFRQGYNTEDAYWECFNPSNSSVRTYQTDYQAYPANVITIGRATGSDMDNDGESEYLVSYYNKSTNVASLVDFEYGGGIIVKPLVSSAYSWLYAVDLNNDNRRDLVGYGSTDGLKLFKTGYTAPPPPPPSTCSLPDCYYPCAFFDDFSYNCTMYGMNWTQIPVQPSLTAESGQYCYNSSALFKTEHLVDGYINEQVVTEQFNMTIYEGDSIVHEFAWQDYSTSNYKIPYHLIWYYNGSNTFIDAYITRNGTYSTVNICQDCWTLGQKHGYEIMQYHEGIVGESFYNQSSSSIQPIKENTYSFRIDNNESLAFYNLENYQTINMNHTNIMHDVYWEWYNEKVCIDDSFVYLGSSFVPPEPTCNLPTCTGNCLVYDDFSYDCSFDDAGWYVMLPNGSDYYPTEDDLMCWDDSVTTKLYFSPNYYDSATTQFSFFMEEDGNFYHWLRYFDSTSSEYKKIYMFNFWETGGHTYIGYWELENDTPVAVSLCTDCFAVNTPTTVKIWHFNELQGDEGYEVENGTYDIAMQSDSVSLLIGDYAFYNLPMYQPNDPHHSTLMNDVGFDWVAGGQTCLIYVKVLAYTDLAALERDDGLNPTHFRQCWVNGSFDWDCCTAEEETQHSFGCVYRVTGYFMLASITSFILQNILYFIVIAIIFVLLTPYIVPALRRQ
jgi:hypothetical protein